MSSKKVIDKHPLIKNIEELDCERQGRQTYHYEVSFRDVLLQSNKNPEKKILSSCNPPSEFESCLKHANLNFIGESDETPSFWNLIEQAGCQIEEVPIEETYDFTGL